MSQTPIDLKPVEAAIARGIPDLVSMQGENGSWPGVNLAGPQYTAQFLIVKQHFGTLEESDREEMTTWILKQQRPDGGFGSSFNAEQSSLPTSFVIRFALEGKAMPASQSDLLDLYIERQGGMAAADPVSLLFGCVAGCVAPEKLGKWSMINRLIPGMDRAMGRRYAAAINLIMVELPCIVQWLQRGKPLVKSWNPLKTWQWKSALRYLTSHQNPSGGFIGMLSPTALGALALEALGVDRSDPRLANAIDHLDHFKVADGYWAGPQIVPYTSEVWNTAAAVKTLLKLRQINKLGHGVHVPAANRGRIEFDYGDYDQNIQRGIDFLLTQQSDGVPPDWLNPAPGAPCDGGWGYGIGNFKGADCDTTAAVMEVLQLTRTAGLRTDLDQPIDKAMQLIDAMQNKSGGWPAFTHGLRQKPPGPAFTTPLSIQQPTFWSAIKMFLNPPLELGDSAWSDLTGRIIGIYAKFDRHHDDPAIARAISFLRVQLAEQPGWWGRWEINYVMASAYALSGLARAKYDIDQSWVSDVTRWVERCQNPDGGWGESVFSYLDPRLAGVGESMPGVTAAVLVSFLDMNLTREPSVQDGIAYLVGTQMLEGRWAHQRATGVMLPPDQFYSNRIYTTCACLSSLCRYHYKVITQTDSSGVIA